VTILWIVKLVVIIFPLLLFIGKLAQSTIFTEASRRYKTVFLLITIPVTIFALLALILELFTFWNISLSGFYGKDLMSSFRGLGVYRGCSGPAMDVAID